MPYKDIEKQKACSRRCHLLKTYNINIEQYEELLKNQNNKCALCGCEPKHNWRSFHVDHDHKTNKIRGLLCKTCNRYVIGGIEKITLIKIITYLTQ